MPLHGARRYFRAFRALRRGFRNWPTLLRTMAAPGRFPDILAVTRRGTRLACPNSPSAWGALVEVFGFDGYDFKFISTWLGPLDSPLILDVGAHVGAFTAAMCELRPKARISSYEPSPSAFAYLSRNVLQNDLHPAVHLFNAGVGAAHAFLPFSDDGRASWVNSADSLGNCEIEAMALADVLGSAGGAVDLMKIDCEGAEFDIVMNSRPDAYQRVARIVMEYHLTNDRTWQQLDSRLSQAGFQLVRHDSDGPGRDSQGLLWFEKLRCVQ